MKKVSSTDAKREIDFRMVASMRREKGRAMIRHILRFILQLMQVIWLEMKRRCTSMLLDGSLQVVRRMR